MGGGHKRKLEIDLKPKCLLDRVQVWGGWSGQERGDEGKFTQCLCYHTWPMTEPNYEASSESKKDWKGLWMPDISKGRECRATFSLSSLKKAFIHSGGVFSSKINDKICSFQTENWGNLGSGSALDPEFQLLADSYWSWCWKSERGSSENRSEIQILLTL